MLLLLTCAREKATSFIALNFVSRNPRYSVLLLREPSLSHGGEPPLVMGFKMFLPTPKNPKCATYVRRSASLQPVLEFSDLDCFIGSRFATAPAPAPTPTPAIAPNTPNMHCPIPQPPYHPHSPLCPPSLSRYTISTPLVGKIRLQTTGPQDVWKVLRSTKPAHSKAIPEPNGRSDFPGKCAALRAALFPPPAVENDIPALRHRRWISGRSTLRSPAQRYRRR